MPLNLNFDGNALVKWAARPVIRRAESYAENVRQRKLIAMAKECASHLKVAGWDVEIWPPERLTTGVLDILSSTKECSTQSGCAQVAAQLCETYHPYDPVVGFVARQLHIPDTLRKKLALIQDGVSANNVCLKMFEDLVAEENMRYVVNALFGCDVMKARGGYLFPLWTMFDDVQQPFKWNAVAEKAYRVEWDATIAELLKSRAPCNRNRPSFKPHPLWCRYALGILDMIVTARVARKKGVELSVSTNESFIEEPNEFWRSSVEGMEQLFGPKSQHWVAIRQQVGMQYLITELTPAYHCFLTRQLGKTGNVGRATNKQLLRKKHVFGKASEDEAVWKSFEQSMTDCTFGIGGTTFDGAGAEDMDLLTSMCKILGGNEYQTPNFQLSIVDNTLGVEEVESKSFLGRISRRHVRLLNCGKDRALIIPYLNTIFFKLSDSRWIRDNDVRALQPFEGVYNQGQVRRAANVFLAMEYDNGTSMVNQKALNVLKQYARKGELYSMDLRDRLLSEVYLKDRVCIRAMITWAREVFGEDSSMVAGFVREMIHDRLLCKSHIAPCRIPDENDAYYDAVYLRSSYSVRNNIDWGPGVPMSGVSIIAHSEDHGTMGKGKVEGYACLLRGYDEELLTLWRRPGPNMPDVDSSSFYISCPTWNDTRRSQLPPLSESKGGVFGDFKVGRYCPSPVVSSDNIGKILRKEDVSTGRRRKSRQCSSRAVNPKRRPCKRFPEDARTRE